MKHRGVAVVWLLAFFVCAVLLGVVWKPFARAWLCYDDWSSGSREIGEVVAAPAEVGLVLRFGESSEDSCTAHLGVTRLEDYSPGDQVVAYRRADRPGECELEPTIEASLALLLALGAMVVVLLLVTLLIAKVVSRSLREVPVLTTRFDAASDPIDCPRCAKPMVEGYLPLLAGIHWRTLAEPIGIPNAWTGLPGTLSFRGRPRLHAYRCESCEVISFRYGGRPPEGSDQPPRADARPHDAARRSGS